jgi:hypothetical protein
MGTCRKNPLDVDTASFYIFFIPGDLFRILLPMYGIYQEYVRNHHYSLQVKWSGRSVFIICSWNHIHLGLRRHNRQRLSLQRLWVRSSHRTDDTNVKRVSQRSIESRGFFPGTPAVSSHRRCWQCGLGFAPWSDMSHEVAARGALSKPSTGSGWAASFAMDHSPINQNLYLNKSRQNSFIAWKSITKLVIFQRFVAKCCKMRII